MAAFWIIVRIVVFLAIVVPIAWWVVRLARTAGELPPDDDHRDAVHHADGIRGTPWTT